MNKAVYKYILQTYGQNPAQWLGFVAEIIRVLVMRVYVTIAMAQVTTSIATGNLEAAKKYTWYFLIAYCAGTIIGTLGEILSQYVENLKYGQLMLSFYKKIVGKDLSFYRDNQTGYLTTVYRQHLDSTILLIRFFRGEALGTLISLIVPPIILYIASPSIGLVAFLIILIQFIYIIWSSGKARLYRELSHEVYRKITGEVSDIITNIIAFKSAGAEAQAENRMVNLIKQETASFRFRRRTTTLLDLPRNLLTAFGIFAAIYLIIIQSTGLNPQPLGLVVLTITYMYQIVRNISSLPELISTHDDLVAKAYPTLRYLNQEHETIADPANPKPLTITNGSICLKNVSFSYPAHVKNGTKIPVFTNLNLTINGGEQIGVVGLSGAGKSTLTGLLLRFDDIDSGSITVDGVDIRTVKQTELRANIAYVPQEPLLFHRSIRENIAYYNKQATEAEVIAAAKAAHAHEFITKLPDQYDTLVGERGLKLSGGQKQRIAIARAILKKARIMIFDEATSALDSESERIIQAALPEIIGQQTALVIAHRLSTVARLDRIIVMHEGTVAEVGSHQELLRLQGRYYSLWKKQTSD